jgi:hypothetical protein
VKNSPTLGTSNSYVASTLRQNFQVLFVIYIPNTPVSCTNVNSFELIKSKGQLGFPKKPSHPRGLLQGASPPQKNGPIFSQKFASMISTTQPKPRANSAVRKRPSGKDARAEDSLRLREDMTLLPHLWTSGPLVESNLPSSNSRRQRKRTTEQCDKRNKRHHFNLQDVSNKQLFIAWPHDPNSNT